MNKLYNVYRDDKVVFTGIMRDKDFLKNPFSEIYYYVSFGERIQEHDVINKIGVSL